MSGTHRERLKDLVKKLLEKAFRDGDGEDNFGLRFTTDGTMTRLAVEKQAEAILKRHMSGGFDFIDMECEKDNGPWQIEYCFTLLRGVQDFVVHYKALVRDLKEVGGEIVRSSKAQAFWEGVLWPNRDIIDELTGEL